MKLLQRALSLCTNMRSSSSSVADTKTLQSICFNIVLLGMFRHHHVLAYFIFSSTNPDRNFSALWGKFAAEILMQNWDAALEDMTRLRELIDAKVSFLSFSL